jgi:hypothetical protein
MDKVVRIHSEQAKRLRTRCPDCNDSLAATGDLQYWPELHQWYVEFFCRRDDQVIPIWTPELEKEARKIAKQVIGSEEPPPG